MKALAKSILENGGLQAIKNMRLIVDEHMPIEAFDGSTWRVS